MLKKLTMQGSQFVTSFLNKILIISREKNHQDFLHLHVVVKNAISLCLLFHFLRFYKGRFKAGCIVITINCDMY